MEPKAQALGPHGLSQQDAVRVTHSLLLFVAPAGKSICVPHFTLRVWLSVWLSWQHC